MDLIASLLGGLGLFLVAVRALGAALQQLAGRRLRTVLGHATRSALGAALTGTLLGALTQSSNAVTVIAASLVQAGLLPLARAVPVVAWCNLGTVALVLAAALDLRIAALWLIGVAGCGLALGPGGGRWKPVMNVAFQLGMLFLGLAIIKAGAGPLRESEMVRLAMAASDHALLPAFLLGAAVALVAQSSSTVTILAIALTEARLLDGGQAGMAVCGASFGSGLSVLMLTGGLPGAAKRLAVFQALFKAFGALLLSLPFLAWQLVPGLPEPWAGLGLPQALGLLFVALQLVPALLLIPFTGRMPALLDRLVPARPEEALSQPRFLYDQALEDVPSALSLAGREQARLLSRLPALLDGLREDAEPAGLSRTALSGAGAELERHIEAFLREALTRAEEREVLARAVALESLSGVARQLRETVFDLSGALEAAMARGQQDPVRPLAPSLAEAMHMLLTELHVAAESGEAADAETLAALAADRSSMMDALRRRVARSGQDLPQESLESLFRVTALFERAVWLVRRASLLLPSATDVLAEEAAAAPPAA